MAPVAEKQRFSESVLENMSALPLSTLPIEISMYLFTFGTYKDLCTWSQVCKTWRVICDDSVCWKNIFFRTFPNAALKVQKSRETASDFRAAYKTEYSKVLLSNFQNGIFSKKRILGPLNSSLCAIYGNVLYSINACSIQKWDIQEKCLKKEYLHEVPSFDPSLFLIQEDFIFFARGSELVQLMTQTLEVSSTFSSACEKKIITFHREKNFLVVGHEPDAINLWNMESKKMISLNYPSAQKLKRVLIHDAILYLVMKSEMVYNYVTFFNLKSDNLFLLEQDNKSRFLNFSNLKVEILCCAEIDSLMVKKGTVYVGTDFDSCPIRTYDKMQRLITTLDSDPTSKTILNIHLFGDLLIATTKKNCLIWDIKQRSKSTRLNLKPLFLTEKKIYSLESEYLIENDFSPEST
jgi:hypothetical protein